jgi:excisionase family DNA binding protein
VENLKIKEAAARLGLSEWTVRAWLREKRLGYIRLGRAIRIPASEVSRIIESGTVKAV